jgi:hypothetical protein
MRSFFLFSVLFALVSCSSDDSSAGACVAPTSCTPADGKLIEITCPTADTKITAGEDLTLTWRSVGVYDFSGYLPRAYKEVNGEGAWENLVTESVLPEENGPDTQCFSFTVPAAEVDDSLKLLRVQDYTSSKQEMRATTDTLTVDAP